MSIFSCDEVPHADIVVWYLVRQVHGDYSEEVGAKIERPVGDDAETDAAAAAEPVPGA